MINAPQCTNIPRNLLVALSIWQIPYTFTPADIQNQHIDVFRFNPVTRKTSLIFASRCSSDRALLNHGVLDSAKLADLLASMRHAKSNGFRLLGVCAVGAAIGAAVLTVGISVSNLLFIGAGAVVLIGSTLAFLTVIAWPQYLLARKVPTVLGMPATSQDLFQKVIAKMPKVFELVPINPSVLWNNVKRPVGLGSLHQSRSSSQ
jgi:hypothetical protein